MERQVWKKHFKGMEVRVDTLHLSRCNRFPSKLITIYTLLQITTLHIAILNTKGFFVEKLMDTILIPTCIVEQAFNDTKCSSIFIPPKCFLYGHISFPTRNFQVNTWCSHRHGYVCDGIPKFVMCPRTSSLIPSHCHCAQECITLAEGWDHSFIYHSSERLLVGLCMPPTMRSLCVLGWSRVADERQFNETRG